MYKPGFPKNSLINPSIVGYPIYGTPPYAHSSSNPLIMVNVPYIQPSNPLIMVNHC